MKNILMFLLSVFIFTSCDYFEDDRDNFIETYKNILIAREKYKDDSAKAESEIIRIYKDFGYTAESFKEEFFEFAGEKPKRFRELLDSIRDRAARESVDIIADTTN